MGRISVKKTVILAIESTHIQRLSAMNYDIGNCLSLLFLQKYAYADELIREKYRIMIAGPISTESQDETDFLELIKKEKPDIIGFSCFLWNIEPTLDLCSKVKQIAPDVSVVLGGPEMNDPHRILKSYPHADFVITGEGEIPFNNFLLEFASDNPAFERVTALSFRKGKKLVINTKPEIIESLECIPDIFDEDLVKRIKEEIYYTTSRGCYGKCKYCAAANRKIRFFPIERIERELKIILSADSISMIMFQDSLLNFNKSKFIQLLNLLILHNKRRIPCSGFVRADLIDDEIMELMRRACLVHIIIGFETTSEDILLKAGRAKINRDTVKSFLKFEKDPEFHAAYTAMYIIPGDSYQGFKKTINDCLKSGMRNILASRVLILPGTHYYSHKEEEGIVADALPPYFVHSCNTFSQQDLFKAERLVLNVRVLMQFIKEPDRIFLQKHNINFCDMAEEIHDFFPQWISLHERRSHFDTEVFCRNPEICDLIGAYINLKMKPGKAFNFFSNLLQIRKSQHKFTNNNPGLAVKKPAKVSPGKCVRTLEYHRLEFPHDYSFYISNPKRIPTARDHNNGFCYVAMHPTWRQGCVYQNDRMPETAQILTTCLHSEPGVTLKSIYIANKMRINLEFGEFLNIVQDLIDYGLMDYE